MAIGSKHSCLENELLLEEEEVDEELLLEEDELDE